MRNSLVPISFPKGDRFSLSRKPTGSPAPYYTIKDVFQQKDAQFKKGWGFGFSARKVFDASKQAYKPGPDVHYNFKTFSPFYKEKLTDKCTFGEPYNNIRKRGDILNPLNIEPITFQNLSPCNYDPQPEKVKRFYGAFTLKARFKRSEEYALERRPGPAPNAYKIEDNLIQQTRYNNILVGGHAPKDSLQFDKNPGPGEYTP